MEMQIGPKEPAGRLSNDNDAVLWGNSFSFARSFAVLLHWNC